MKKLVGVFIFVFLIFNANAQNIDTTLAKYAKEYEPERMYLHYDKSSYFPGETIWFKAYLMKSIFPDDESKTVYVDWSNENGQLLFHTVCAVDDAATFGQFKIPDNYDGQFIHVKAYTKWMLNFDSVFLYNKDVRIISKNKDAIILKKAVTPEIHFFPEGGDINMGVTNKIAFKANDQYGEPILINGVIKDNAGSFIDSLHIIHDGMGYFFVRPTEGETFVATWEDNNEKTFTTSLPAIFNEGVALHVTISGNRRNFSVSAAPASVSVINDVHIVGTMYQQMIFNLDEQLKDGTVEGSIPTESLPSGILTITVFDKEWKPLAERITYVNNEEYSFHPEISVATSGLDKLAKNQIEISVPGDISSNLSVSVTDSKIDNDSSDNIISHLLLTGELKGYVNDPEHYFLNNSDSITKQLDLVMLTHGWRRFNWEKVVKGEYPQINYPKDTSYLSLSGKIFGLSTSQLQNPGDIILMLTQKNSGTQTFTIPYQSNGTFNDPSLILFDTAHIFYNLSNIKNQKKISVQFMPDILPALSDNTSNSNNFYFKNESDTSGNHYHFQLSSAQERELKYLNGKILAPITIKSKIKSHMQEVNDKYTKGMFKGGNATELDLLDDPLAVAYTDIVSYIQGKVPGLTYDNIANKFLWMRNRSGENGPTLYLNEMPTSYSMISTIPVANVAYIKVFRPGFIGGVGSGTGGAIVIYTRLGGEDKTNVSEGLNNSLVSGYSVVREFYTPDYDNIKVTDDKKDLRTTLYWNPSVTTTPDQNSVTLTFFNNDITNDFRVVIEGMAKDGRLAHVEKIIK